MPTFEIPNAFVEGTPDTGRYHVRDLAASGDVDGNTYRNLLYASQFIIGASEDNLGSIFVGGATVSPTNYDVELHAFESLNQNQSGGIDNYVCIEKSLAPPGAPTVANGAAGTNLLGAGDYEWKITFVTADGETEAGTVSATLTNDPAAELPPALSAIPTDATSGVTVTARKIYRTEADGSVFKLVDTLADNVTTTYTDDIPDASLGADAPTTNSAVPQKVTMFWESPFPVG
jgi:hypothetical protein